MLWALSVATLTIGFSASFRTSLWGIARTLLHWGLLLPLLGLFLTVVLATIMAVLLGRIAGFWEILPVVGALSWFLFSGIGFLMNYDKYLEGESALKFPTKGVLLAAFATAVLSASTLPLLLELLIFPVLSFLSLVFASLQSNRSDGFGYTTIATLLASYVLLSLALATLRVIEDSSIAISILQSLLLPVCLAIPSLLYVRCLVTWERTWFLWSAAKRRINASDYGDKWPLTLGSALLCAKDNAVWIEANGKRYRLNGTAEGVFGRLGVELAEIREIQRVDDKLRKRFEALLDLEGLDPQMMSVQPLIRDGLALDSTRRR